MPFCKWLTHSICELLTPYQINCHNEKEVNSNKFSQWKGDVMSTSWEHVDHICLYISR